MAAQEKEPDGEDTEPEGSTRTEDGTRKGRPRRTRRKKIGAAIGVVAMVTGFTADTIVIRDAAREAARPDQKVGPECGSSSAIIRQGLHSTG